MQFKRRILYDGLYTIVLRIANIAVALALGVLTARLLGPTGKGIYAIPVVQAGLVSSMFGGLSSATSYYLLNGKAGRRIVAPSVIGLMVFVVGAALVILPIARLGDAIWAAPAAIASLPATAAANTVTGYVTGIKRIRYASSFTVATTFVTFLVTVAGFFLVARSPFVAIAAWVAATSLVAVVAVAAMLLHARTLASGDAVSLKSYLGLALKVGTGNLISLLNYRADLYLVAIMLPPSDLGLYIVATSAPQSLLLPTQAASQVTSPHIGSLEKSAAARLAARCVRNNLLMALVVCIVVFVFAPFIIELFYGAAFVPLVPALRILLVGVVVLSLGSPVSTYYTLKLARPEVPLVLAALSAAICTAGCLILIPRFNIIGAAAASSAGYIVGQTVAFWYFTKSTGITYRSMLVPTVGDLRVYFDFARNVYRDGTRFLTPRHSVGK